MSNKKEATTPKNKLFRMTKKRILMMDSIIRLLDIKMDTKGADGLSRMLLLENDQLSEEKKEARIKTMDEELSELYLCHDILEIIACHQNPEQFERFAKEKRDWTSEWDVPQDVFNEAMDQIIALIQWYQARTPKDRYAEQIQFILLLKTFRNNGEQPIERGENL